jgi:uncharacterized membrane protein
MNTKTTATGAALAFAVATLFAGLTSTIAVAEEAQIHCYGVNACKGQNDCKTASNACKGQGFKTMTLAECNLARCTVGG